MLRKLKIKFKSQFYENVLKLSMVIGNPRFTASVLAIITGRIKRGSEYTALVLGRTIFYDDIDAMARFSRKLNYAIIHLSYWEIIFSHFTDPAERKMLTETNYYSSDYCRKGKENYYRYLKQMFPYLKWSLKIDAIISGNIGYVVQQELAKVCGEQGVPFIALHKEAMDVYGGRLESYSDFKFIGARILFYNNRIREEALKRIAGLSEGSTAVVGIPRFDSYFRDQRKPNHKQVVFFCFYPKDKFLAIIRDEQKLARAKQAYADFHKLMIDFAAEHPDFRVIMKTKNAQYYMDYVLGILRASHQTQPSNLVITKSGKASDLILSSSAVIGFDSTALIEAVAADRPVICPDFRDFVSSQSWNFFAGFEGLVNYVKIKQDLDKFLLGPMLQTDQTKPTRNTFLERLIGPPDGNASIRAESAILETIKNY